MCIRSYNKSYNSVVKNLLTVTFSTVRRFALLVSPGFEPRQRESKSLVLPLHHETTQCECSHRGLRAHFYHMAWHLASIKYVLRSVSGLAEPPKRTRATLGYFVQERRDCILSRRMPGFHLTRSVDFIACLGVGIAEDGSRARGDWLPLHLQRYCRCSVRLFHCAPWEDKNAASMFYISQWMVKYRCRLKGKFRC